MPKVPDKPSKHHRVNKKSGWRKFSVEKVCEALRMSRGFKSPAAKILGCDRSTLDDYESESEDIRRVIREERERMGDLAEAGLYRKLVAEEEWAIKFYLRTRCKDRGYILTQEVALAAATGSAVLILPSNGREVVEDEGEDG